jgi:hypothetical protein
MASLQSSTFDFLDEHHILFPSSIDESLYVYDIRSMPPMKSRRRKSKGTHCFEIPVPKFLRQPLRVQSRPPLQLARRRPRRIACPFHADPHQRMVTLLITAAPNPTARMDSRTTAKCTRGQARCSHGRRCTQRRRTHASSCRGRRGDPQPRELSRHGSTTRRSARQSPGSSEVACV